MKSNSARCDTSTVYMTIIIIGGMKASEQVLIGSGTEPEGVAVHRPRVPSTKCVISKKGGMGQISNSSSRGEL